MSQKSITIHVPSTSETITVSIDKNKVLEIPPNTTNNYQDFTATFKTTLATIQSIFLELVDKNSSHKKLYDLNKGTHFVVKLVEDKIEVQQQRVYVEEKTQSPNLKSYAKKTTTPVAKKWATVESVVDKKKQAAKAVPANVVNKTEDDAPKAEIITGSQGPEQKEKVYFYFGHFHYDESGETEPCSIVINDKRLFSSSQVNGKVIELEIAAPKLGFDHKVSMIIEGPQGTIFNKRVNLSGEGYHILVKRIKNSDELKIEQSSTGDEFKPIVEEEAKKQAESGQQQETETTQETAPETTQEAAPETTQEATETTQQENTEAPAEAAPQE
jgi:hypothetical protein